MRWIDTYVRGATSVFGTTATAVPSVAAARALLADARVSPDHKASIYHLPSGPDGGTARTIAQQLQLDTVAQPVVTILDGRPGVIAALDLAARQLQSADRYADPPTALITAGGAPNRSTDPSAGGALLLSLDPARSVSRRPGVLRLLSTATVHAPAPDDAHVTSKTIQIAARAISAALRDCWAEYRLDCSLVEHLVTPGADEAERVAFREMGGRLRAINVADRQNSPATQGRPVDLLVQVAAAAAANDIKPRDWVLLVAAEHGFAGAALLRAVRNP